MKVIRLTAAALRGGFLNTIKRFFSLIIICFSLVAAVSTISGCSSVIPNIIVFTSEDRQLYYFPVSIWKTKDLYNISLNFDVTYNTNDEINVICNISFLDKNRIPENVLDEIYIYADEIEYKLRDVTVMFVDPKLNAYRITSFISFQELISICSSNHIKLAANVNNVDCIFYPSKDFIRKKEQFISLMGIE